MWRTTRKKTSACDCFCLKQQINDLLIFLHKTWEEMERVDERNRHTHTQKKIVSKKYCELGPMQYTKKIPIDINVGSPLSTTTKTAIRKASFILFVGHIVGVCTCVCM